jgi:SAM-dependent methyltransferase
MATELDQINRGVWRSSRVLEAFARRDGWMDPGEARVMEALADEARGQPILDIGVGTGRTLPHLRSLSEDYIAIDYLEEMVQLTSSRYPEARVEHGDARDLSAYPDGAFGLVVFSYNGIDGIAHEDRPKVLAAVDRVLRPGGLFAYSTHNLSHRCAGRPPWHPCWFRPSLGARAMASAAYRLPQSARSYRRLRPREIRADGWATMVDPAYSFSVVWHYVTIDEELRNLREAGFSDLEVLTTAGEAVERAEATQESPWLHYLARKLPG